MTRKWEQSAPCHDEGRGTDVEGRGTVVACYGTNLPGERGHHNVSGKKELQ